MMRRLTVSIEVFAYACEAYNSILSQATSISERRQLADKFNGFPTNDDRADANEVAQLVITQNAYHRDGAEQRRQFGIRIDVRVGFKDIAGDHYNKELAKINVSDHYWFQIGLQWMAHVMRPLY